jgi:predicted O-linked N-acetylglucosamine transferase (SPINDLY family)
MGLQGEGQHLNFYRDVDIALDAHPFNGGVTTLEGLWMGVPIITRVGERTVARTGLSILAQLDMAALAARTPEQYIKIVAVLAANPSALARIRSTLRQRMRASTLCHHEIYVTQLERAYRDLWHAHCQSQNPVAATTVGGRSL